MTSERAIETTRSFCRICTCLCGILVDLDGDEVVRVIGDRDHPVTAGYSCVKGRSLPQMHHHPRRLEYPMMRVDRQLQRVTWESCLDDLGERLRAIIEQHGPSSVAIFFGSGLGLDAAGYRMAEALHAAIGTPARMSPLTIDGTAKVLAASLVGGFPGLNPRPDYEHAQLVVYFGVNPVVSHGHATAMPSPTTTLRALLKRGGDLWVIDPRRSETAALATGHIAPRPGTDYAILAYLVRELLRDADAGALARRTTGSDTLRTVVEPFTRDNAADVAGIPSEQLDDLMAAIRRHGPVAIETGTGITMSADANIVTWLAWVVMILTDSMNRPGGVWFHPGFFTRIDGAPIPAIPPEAFFAPGPPSRPELPGFLGEWPCAALPDEINAGNVRAVLNLGGGLLTAFPETNVLRPALERLDALATLEIMHNDVTALSTHVLPTKDQLERADINMWDFISPSVVAQYTPAVVAPVGERKSSWWILAELGRRLGYDFAADAPADDSPDSDNSVLAKQLTRARCTWDELVADGYVGSEDDIPMQWVDDYIDRIGGWRLAPPQLVEQIAHVPSPPPLCLTPRRQKRHVNSQLTYLGDEPEVLLHPADASAAGVGDGDPVVVRSASGEIVGIARIDEHIRRGVVSVPHGYEHANVNVLTDHTDADPITGMAHYSGIAVTVHAANGQPGR